MWTRSMGTDGAHYSIFGNAGDDGMDMLRKMFPYGWPDEMNFVLFSTGGIHGTYATIEEIEREINSHSGAQERCRDLTFLVVHPRMVCLRYGTATPRTWDDFDFLKKLRDRSRNVMMKIGY